MSLTAKTVLDRLNTIIEESGHSNESLADMVHVSVPTLIRARAGSCDFTLNQLARLCEALNHSMVQLFAETETVVSTCGGS